MRPQHDEDNHLFVQPSISWSQVAIPSLAEEVERPLQSPLSSEINRLMTQLLEERQRRARLDNTKIKRQRYGKSAFERIGQKLAVKVAAQLLTEMRRQKLKPRLIILMLTVLAHAHALIPIMFVAAVAVVIRTGVQKAKAGETRSDLDAAAAAQRGFRFNEVSRYDRKAYAFIGNSLLNPGFNPKPAIETLGTEKAARFLTWWVHASSKQRAIVLSWDVDRRQNPPRSLHVKAPTGIAATASSFTVIYPTTKEPEPVPSEDTGQKPPDPTKSTLPKTQVRKKRSRRGKNDWGR